MSTNEAAWAAALLIAADRGAGVVEVVDCMNKPCGCAFHGQKAVVLHGELSKAIRDLLANNPGPGLLEN